MLTFVANTVPMQREHMINVKWKKERSKGVFEKSQEQQQQKHVPNQIHCLRNSKKKVNQLSFSQVYKWGWDSTDGHKEG